MPSQDKIAFFDFCETLVKFQTADRFIDYVRITTMNPRMIRIEKIMCFLQRVKVITFVELLLRRSYSINKRLKLYQLKGFKLDRLNMLAQNYYDNVIKPNFIETTLCELIELKKRGYKICVVSGGYDLYLKFFVADYEVDNLLCTKIKIKNGICTGMMDGRDCMSKYKVYLMDKLYFNHNFHSISFSDSSSDIPMLKWANESYVVINRNKIIPKWVENYKFKLLLWD